MRAAWVISVVVGIISFVATVLTYGVPEFVCLLISFLTLMVLVALFIAFLLEGFSRWRKISRIWWAPSILCLIFITSSWGARLTGNAIADQRFESHMAPYLKIVGDFKNGSLSCTQACNKEFDIINASYLPSGIKALFIARCDNGPIVVAFGARTDIPLLHEGYFYRDYRDGDACVTEGMKPENKWPYVRHVLGNWYHFSNQPGL